MMSVLFSAILAPVIAVTAMQSQIQLRQEDNNRRAVAVRSAFDDFTIYCNSIVEQIAQSASGNSLTRWEDFESSLSTGALRGNGTSISDASQGVTQMKINMPAWYKFSSSSGSSALGYSYGSSSGSASNAGGSMKGGTMNWGYAITRVDDFYDDLTAAEKVHLLLFYATAGTMTSNDQASAWRALFVNRERAVALGVVQKGASGAWGLSNGATDQADVNDSSRAYFSDVLLSGRRMIAISSTGFWQLANPGSPLSNTLDKLSNLGATDIPLVQGKSMIVVFILPSNPSTIKPSQFCRSLASK